MEYIDTWKDHTFTITQMEDIPKVCNILPTLRPGWHIIRLRKTLGLYNFGPDYLLSGRNDPIYNLYYHRKTEFTKEVKGVIYRVYIIVISGPFLILQSKQSDGTKFDFVSGGINPGESHVSAARREIQEELGIIGGNLVDLKYTVQKRTIDLFYKPEERKVRTLWHYYLLDIGNIYKTEKFIPVIGNAEVKMIAAQPLNNIRSELLTKSAKSGIWEVNEALQNTQHYLNCR